MRTTRIARATSPPRKRSEAHSAPHAASPEDHETKRADSAATSSAAATAPPHDREAFAELMKARAALLGVELVHTPSDVSASAITVHWRGLVATCDSVAAVELLLSRLGGGAAHAR